jgi:pSer/pThr/pTyr-binding forkhead associated (FHA) protein
MGGKQAMMPRQPHPHATPLRNGRVIIELAGKIIGERPLDKPVLTVGRLSGNDVQIPNQRVSRLHAKIRYEDGLWIIEDADSVNGVVYQGSQVDQHILSDGDRIYIAPTVILHFQATKVGGPPRT